MKQFGFILFLLGSIAACFTTALDPETLPWLAYVACLLVAGFGLFLLKKAQHAALKNDAVVADNLQQLDESLNKILVQLERLVAERESIPPYEFRFEIDRHFREDLNLFAEARHSMGHKFGLQHYAEVMSPFAAGERYINRIWTASTDGYIDEVQLYLDRALEQFKDAREKLTQAEVELAKAI